MRHIARPGTNQRILYNGHKRVHSLKFQAVAIPNGLIAHFSGPFGKNLIYSLAKIEKQNHVGSDAYESHTPKCGEWGV